MLRATIKQEVRKEIRSGDSSERKKVTMELKLPDTRVYMNGKAALNNCIRIPITKAIPAIAGSGADHDVRRRESNAIMLTEVNVRVSFSVSYEMRLLILPYESHPTAQVF